MSKRDKPDGAAGASANGSARPDEAQRSDVKRWAGRPERAARELQASHIRGPGAGPTLSFAQLQASRAARCRPALGGLESTLLLSLAAAPLTLLACGSHL